VGVVESVFGLPSLLLAGLFMAHKEYLLPACMVVAVGIPGAVFSATFMRFSVHEPLK